MEPLLPTVVAVCVFYTFVLAAVGRQRARLRAWHQAAAEAAAATRLDDVRANDSFVGAFLEGRAGGLRVRLESYRHGRYESGTRLVIQGLARLSIRRESAATAIEKRFLGETEVELGSPMFDDQCYVNGTPAHAFAVLDAEARRCLASALAGRLTLDENRSLGVRASLAEGTLHLECRASWGGRNERVGDLLRGGLSLARQLTLPPDIPRRIALNLRSEPEPGVRLAALLTLAREYPNNPATRPALLAAREDESDEVRLRAAMALGEEGRETLLALVASKTTDDACAARAVTALGEHLPEAEAAKALRLALDSGRTETAIACLDRLGGPGLLESEDSLLAALRTPVDPVRIAAARALGRAGTVAAVRELRVISDSGSSELRGAARHAIAAIQSRLPGASPGQLSLAGGEAGALALVDDAAGNLSVVETAEGGSPVAEAGEDRRPVEASQLARDPDAANALPAAPRSRQRE